MLSSLQQMIENILQKPSNTWFSYLSKLLHRFITGSIYPGAGYIGIWPRDAAYILNAWLLFGEDRRGLRECRRIWENRIRKYSIVVVSRSGNTFIPTKIADSRFREEYSGLLPTTIMKKCLEVYGAKPDIDSTALMIDITCKFLKRVDSENVRSELLPLLEQGAEALRKLDYDGDYILEQGPNEDWMDTAYRSGKVLYSNLCWASALKSLSSILENGRGDYWYDIYKETVKAITWKFRLNTDNPIGVIGPRAYRYHVWQDTALAVEHVDIESIVQILNKRLKTKIGPRVVHPFLPYNNWRSRRWGYYHNGGFWPWFSSYHVIALSRYGYVDEAWDMMEKVLRYCLYEWVEPVAATKHGPAPFRTGCASALYALAHLSNGVK